MRADRHTRQVTVKVSLFCIRPRPHPFQHSLFVCVPPSVPKLGVPADPKGGASVVDDSSSSSSSAKPRERTLEELRAECRKRGMTGFSHLKKKELIRRMEGTP